MEFGWLDGTYKKPPPEGEGQLPGLQFPRQSRKGARHSLDRENTKADDFFREQDLHGLEAAIERINYELNRKE